MVGQSTEPGARNASTVFKLLYIVFSAMCVLTLQFVQAKSGLGSPNPMPFDTSCHIHYSGYWHPAPRATSTYQVSAGN